MKTAIRNIILSTAIALSASTLSTASEVTRIDTQSLAPLQAHTIALQDFTTVVYYTVLENGDFQIVTSTGPNPGVEGEMTQNVITVEPGESLVYSLQPAPGMPPIDIQFAAAGQSLVVASR